MTSIAEMVIESVNGTDVDVRKELFAGVILTGAPFGVAHIALALSLLALTHSHWQSRLAMVGRARKRCLKPGDLFAMRTRLSLACEGSLGVVPLLR